MHGNTVSRSDGTVSFNFRVIRRRTSVRLNRHVLSSNCYIC